MIFKPSDDGQTIQNYVANLECETITASGSGVIGGWQIDNHILKSKLTFSDNSTIHPYTKLDGETGEITTTQLTFHNSSKGDKIGTIGQTFSNKSTPTEHFLIKAQAGELQLEATEEKDIKMLSSVIANKNLTVNGSFLIGDILSISTSTDTATFDAKQIIINSTSTQLKGEIKFLADNQTANKISFENVPKENQLGIYARFA